MMLIDAALRHFSNGRCSMKIALIGATGHVGHYFLNEALQRGHAVPPWSATRASWRRATASA